MNRPIILSSVSSRISRMPPGFAPNGAEEDMDACLRIEDVYRQCGCRIYSLASRMLGNETDAEDVAQEVLLQVIRRLDTFRGDSAVMTWLFRVTVNAALALRRKRATARERHFVEAGDGGCENVCAIADFQSRAVAPDAETLRSELRERMETAIAKLPEKYRDPFLLADVEELSYREITEILGLSLSAVKSRIHRARLMLRDALREYVAEECLV